MRSTRWLPGSTTKVAVRGQPQIDKGGHATTSLLMWKCSSAQWFSTLAKDVYWRLRKRLNKGKSTKKHYSRDLLGRIAIYYATTMNDSGLERLSRCNNRKVTRRLLEYLLHKMDENQWFLYGQMCQSILWLQSRGNPRAKSIKKTILPYYRRISVKSYDCRREIYTYLAWLSDPWIVGPLRYQRSGEGLLSRGIVRVSSFS